jgi:hypothetical protein
MVTVNMVVARLDYFFGKLSAFLHLFIRSFNTWYLQININVLVKLRD